jgi:hypothetical protein
MSADPTFRRSGNQVTRTIGGETLVVPIRSEAADLDSLYVFNGCGAAVWQLLETPRTIDEIAHELAGEYEVAGHSVEGDVTRFMDMLKDAGLVEEGARA